MDTIEKSCFFKYFKNGLCDFVDFLYLDRPFGEVYFSVENSNLTERCWQKNPLSVGKNMATSQFVVDFLLKFYDKKYVIEFSPLGKGKKIENLAVFNAYTRGYSLTGYKGLQTEQDKRDAFKLAYLGYMKINEKKLF
jgi:hypothetical protein